MTTLIRQKGTQDTAMRLSGFDIMVVELPVAIEEDRSITTPRMVRNILVAVHDDNRSVGWGESSPNPVVTGGTISTAIDALRERILPRLAQVEYDSFDQVRETLTGLLSTLPGDQQAAFCAAELALLDLAGIRFAVSAGEVLGPIRKGAVHYSGVIAAETGEQVQMQAALMRKRDVRHVKLSLTRDLDTNLQYLDIARQILGPEVQLRIDAEGLWDTDEAIRQLGKMQPYRLAGVEQPVPAKDLVGMQRVTAAGLVPVVADESLVTLEDAHRLAEQQACDIFSVRISDCGGLINAGRIRDVARAAGLGCQLGARAGETGLLSAAGRQFGTRSEGLRWYEGSHGAMTVETVVTEPDIAMGPAGIANALREPGLGVSVRSETIEEFTTQRISVH